MSFIINYINKQLMIHFSDVVVDGEIKVLDDSNEVVNMFYIQNKEFVNLFLPLKNGIYHIKIIDGNIEKVKSIIINN